MLEVLVYSCRGCFSGVIAKDPRNHPTWEQPLAQALAGLGVYGYETPSSSENFTALTLDVEVDGVLQPLRTCFFLNIVLRLSPPPCQFLFGLLVKVFSCLSIEVMS